MHPAVAGNVGDQCAVTNFISDPMTPAHERMRTDLWLRIFSRARPDIESSGAVED